MFLSTTLLLASALFISQGSAQAMTVEQCYSTTETEINRFIKEGASLRMHICNLLNEYAACIYGVTKQKMEPKEGRRYMALVESALKQTGESGRICETDYDGIMSGKYSDVSVTDKEFQDQVTACLPREQELHNTFSDNDTAKERQLKMCQLYREFLMCVTQGLKHKPTESKVQDMEISILEQAQQVLGVDLSVCGISFQAMVDNRDWENGAPSGLILGGYRIVHMVGVVIVAVLTLIIRS